MATKRLRGSERGRLRVSEWVLGIIAGIAVFLGLFILFGGDDQSIGIGGTVSWRVGDIAQAWAYGLLAGGVAAALATIALVRRDRSLPATAVPARSSRADLYIHATVFVLVNAFLWTQDILIGGGLDYAYWVTIPWAVGLAAHAIAEFAPDMHRPLPH